MKKILALCLVAILCFALVGCNNNNNEIVDDENNPSIENNENQGNENVDNSGEEENIPAIDPNSASGRITAILGAAGIQVMAPMQDVIPVEMSEAYIGLSAADFEAYVADSVFYESMISPANQSFCLIKVNDKSKVEELKQKIFDNCNPRKWICMTAERVVVLDSGEYIMLAMASQDSCNVLIPTFKAEFGEANVGEILDKTVSESIENMEDLPGGGSMAL